MRTFLECVTLLLVVGVCAERAAGATYELNAGPSDVIPGETITVNWNVSPDGVSGSDWIALFRVGGGDSYLAWAYTGGTTTGSLEFTAPNELGAFEFRYLLQNGYEVGAISNVVTVRCFSNSTTTGPGVLVLKGGDLGSDCAIARILNQRGFVVTMGPTIPQWDGTQADLSEFAVVVLPHNANWPAAALEAGITALTDFVMEGGGLVTGEWALWGAFGRGQASLVALAPIGEYCGYNSASGTTFTRVTADPIIDDGLPSSFSVPLQNVAGTESCFEARPEATVFFSSSNGGGRADADGLSGWDVGRGRVASFSTLLTETELADDNQARLLANTVVWASQPACTAAPATPDTLPNFVDCLLGPGVVVDPACALQDLDCNRRIDLRDVGFLQRTFDAP